MIGTIIGRFRLVGELGRGGMGTVWKAEDQLLGRPVALKLLSPSLASLPDARRRFLREARAASALDHPGVARVHDFGESGDRVYIAFACVQGETVSERAARAPLPYADAARIVAEAADALAHAHERGVIHRDITGRNIMVTTEGRAVVLDFGLALAAGSSRITSGSVTMGTAAYMAPEIAQGRAADERCDLYGLGVVLYELATGTLPFAGRRPEEVLYSALHQAVEPPSRRRPGLPEGLERVILRAMARDPGLRYQRASELAADLRALAL